MMPHVTLTPKQEAFARQMSLGQTQSDAYRKAFKPKHAKASSIHCNASKVMALTKVRQRINELQVGVQATHRKTREEYLDLAQACAWFDPRKMYDTLGNPLEVPALGEPEAMMLAGFEVVEDFTKVKRGSGEEDAVATGYTKKFRLADRHKFAALYGKAMGFIDEDDTPEDQRTKSIHVTFISAKGENVQVNVSNGNATGPNGHGKVGVTFVK